MSVPKNSSTDQCRDHGIFKRHMAKVHGHIIQTASDILYVTPKGSDAEHINTHLYY